MRDREEMLGDLTNRQAVAVSTSSAMVTLGYPSDPPLITDEDLTSPLHSSVSVMCCPNMIDAATQTDSLTADVAVRLTWPLSKILHVHLFRCRK